MCSIIDVYQTIAILDYFIQLKNKTLYINKSVVVRSAYI